MDRGTIAAGILDRGTIVAGILDREITGTQT